MKAMKNMKDIKSMNNIKSMKNVKGMKSVKSAKSVKCIKNKLAVGMAAALLAAAVLGGCGNDRGSEDGNSEQGQNSVELENSGVTDSQEEASESGSAQGETPESGEASESGTIPGETEEETPILKDAVQEAMGCRIGAAATLSELQDEKVWEIITTHFNALTFGNELKPDCMFGYSNGRCPGTEETELNGETMTVPKMDFSRAEKMLDKVLSWNQEHPDNQIKVRGHVLVWHSQTPEWFFHEDYDKNKDYVDKETMNKRLEWYIRTMLTHFTGEDSKYKGMFYGWDVVNEAISDGTGTYRSDKENPDEPLSQDTHGSNSSWWHVYQSNEYILNAFLYANKYAPADLELYYNDYNECSFSKQWGILELLEAVKEMEGAPGEGTRIDGMGMQGHYSMTYPDWGDFSNCIELYAKAVGNVQITEFDMSASDGYDGSEEAKAEEYEKQAGRYRLLYWTLKKANEKEGINITGITFWGTVDQYSWLQSRSNVGGGNTTGLPQCPLLFDENYQPKPAFYEFIKK